MKKVISTISFFIISLFVLSVFGWMSVNISKGVKDFGLLNEPIKFMYSFLDQFKESVEEVKKESPTFLKTEANYKLINNLKEDLNVLMSFSESDHRRSVVIMNLRNDSILFKWNIKDTVNEHDRIKNPIAYPNRDLVYSYTMKSGIKRIDSTGKVLWKQDGIIGHHSLNLDSSGYIWACTRKAPEWWDASGKYKLYGRTVYFEDDFLTKLDPNTGKILYHKSLAEVFKENKIANYFLQTQSGQDPMHLNDIQPALKTTKYYSEGDLFLSLKQISLILHFRPSTGEVIKVIKGPFSAQHDVDFLNDSTLTWFNNSYYALWTEDSKPKPKNAEQLDLTADFFSNIVQYNFSTEEFAFIGEKVFRDNWIFTGNEGLHEFINDSTYFVEQQNQGYIWVIQNDLVIYKGVYKSQKEGYHHLPNWTRIIKK